jgi:hypothetical protein
VLPRVLSLLLAHDGIVAADPIVDLSRAAGSQPDDALGTLGSVVAALAQVEPLVSHGLLRFTRHRPALTQEARRAVLDFFGIDPSLTVFTNFVEAAVYADESPVVFEREYLLQVRELFRLIGLTPPTCSDLNGAVDAVRNTAAAMIELSWQVAVCAQDGSCDLALSSAKELELANVMLAGPQGPASEQVGRQLGKTRHVLRCSVGELPNVDAVHLTIEDAIAIRRFDMFEEFRARLRRSLDELDQHLRTGQPAYMGRAIFEDAMSDASMELSRSVRRSSLKDQLRDASLPAAIGVADSLWLSQLGPAPAAAGVVATTLSGIVWQWLTGRKTPGLRAARRYFSILSGDAARRR